MMLDMKMYTLRRMSKFVDTGLASAVRGLVCWEGDHVRV